MKNINLTFRIEGGRYKGRTLQLPSKQTTRSTKSIVKGSLFDTLQNEIVDTIFVEGFGGSGSVGLEAISRGAKHAYFVEKDHDSYSVLKKNIAAIDSTRCTAWEGDTFERLPELMQKLEAQHQEAYVYLDPPFSVREGMDDIYEKTMDMIQKFSPQTIIMIVVEHESTVVLPPCIGLFSCSKQRRFGRTTLSYYRLAS